MVGKLNLLHVCEEDPLDMSCPAERGLDSPDSGLPQSPSPSAWLLPAGSDPKARSVSPVSVSPVSVEGRKNSLVQNVHARSFQALSFGEGIALDPLPAKEMRYTSSIHYDSDRHFIQDVALHPWGQGLHQCRQTVVALSHSTWRHYKTQLDFQPCHRPERFKSTTIIYPKKTSAAYTTELSYNCHRLSKRFMSSVELETADLRKLPQ